MRYFILAMIGVGCFFGDLSLAESIVFPSTQPVNYQLSYPNAYGSVPANSADFVMVIDTTKVGKTGQKSFEIPTTGSQYNYTVAWGDGTINTGVSGDIEHEYATEGIYEIRIRGSFPRIYFKDNFGSASTLYYSDNRKLLDVKQRGTSQRTSMEGAFYGCENMIGSFVDSPNLANVTNVKEMFVGAKFFNGNVSGWDTSSVEDMSSMFEGASNFNRPLDQWDVSHVSTMSGMFAQATSFNHALGLRNTSMVSDMTALFSGATSFDQDVSLWDLSSVASMDHFLDGARLSTINYERLLLSMDQQSLSDAIVFDGGASTYCSPAAAAARSSLQSQQSRTITDGGNNCRYAEYRIQHYRQSANGLYENHVEILSGVISTAVVEAIPQLFSGWTYDPTHTGNITTGMIQSDGSLVLSLYYTINRYDVFFDSMGGTSVPAQYYVPYHYAAIEPPDPTRTGYNFSGWYLSGAMEPYDFSTLIVDDVHLYAQWEKRYFSSTKTVTVSESVQKNDCPDNLTGTITVVYATGTAMGTGTTQTGADMHALEQATLIAQDNLDTIKQSFANDQGACVKGLFSGTYTATASHVFMRNNCPSGYVGSMVDYVASMTKTAQSDTQSQADLLAKYEATTAVNDYIVTHGQTYANTYGTCTRRHIPHIVHLPHTGAHVD